MPLLRFFVGSVLPASLAELVELQASGSGLFIFRSRVIALFAILTLQTNDLSHAFSFGAVAFGVAFTESFIGYFTEC